MDNTTTRLDLELEVIDGYRRVPTIHLGWASSLMDLGFRWEYEVPQRGLTVYREV